MELTELDRHILLIFKDGIGGISATDVQNDLFDKRGEYHTHSEIRNAITTMAQIGYIERRERISFSANIDANEFTFGLALAGKVALKYKRSTDSHGADYLRKMIELAGKPITVKAVAEVYRKNEGKIPKDIPAMFATLVSAEMATPNAKGDGICLTTFGKNIQTLIKKDAALLK